ncbi:MULTISPECIES: hypothetical protein [Rhodococcus]|jgi:hypothetical protein|uniref:Uncharacterized protein n=2 Tax=Rhodococcus erythropolis TaxID=1833 RepID=C0ZUJ1_RHOE4|nr:MULTISPECIES: hypothetical protein [Rhodococcus]RAL36488.1 hypothetical protein CVN56_04925 [Rhodococcus sp. AQ5-07]WMN02086.1 hypothetical protein QIE55_30490 [Rhodococcus erythropolis]BAH32236.1 hypothetical protein RER_15280 [Rhodococcus erythropolis PR4]
MDTASLIDVIGSFDVASLTAPLASVQELISTAFSVVSAFIDVGVSGSAASAGSIQTALGSIAAQ